MTEISHNGPVPHIHAIYRYPIKGLSAEPLARAALAPGQTIAGDRLYAIENGPSGFDAAAPAHLSKTHFLMLMKNERLAAPRTAFDLETHTLTITFPSPACGGGMGGGLTARGDLRTKAGRLAIEAFFRRFMPKELRGPPKVLHAENHSFSDVARKVISIINLASVAAVEAMVGAPVNPLRFRGNVYVEGWPAWSELDLVGKELIIGRRDHALSPPPLAGEGQGGGQSGDPIAPVRLKIVKRITRCAATNVDPDTGLRDLEVPQALMRNLEHADCGIYAEVVEGGEVAAGDTIEILR
jgi:uncharacterized protein YcbX